MKSVQEGGYDNAGNRAEGAFLPSIVGFSVSEDAFLLPSSVFSARILIRTQRSSEPTVIYKTKKNNLVEEKKILLLDTFYSPVAN